MTTRTIYQSAALYARQLGYRTGWVLFDPDEPFAWERDMPPAERVYRCDGCGLVLDRDVNAARNLLSLSSASSARFEACGDSSLGESAKQEPSIMNNE